MKKISLSKYKYLSKYSSVIVMSYVLYNILLPKQQ